MENKYLIIFDECKLVKGYRQGLVYDLERNENSNFVPNSLCDFVEKSKSKSINELKSFYEKDINFIDEYINFILNKEYGIITDLFLKNNLGELNLNFFSSSIIENAIIIIHNFNEDYLYSIIKILDELGCFAVELRINLLNISDFKKLESIFSLSRVETIILRINYFEEIEKFDLTYFFNQFNRLKLLYIYSSPFEFSEKGIIKIIENINLYNDFGKVKKTNFTIKRKQFIESQKFNTYFNQKLFINERGEIKNAPECDLIFGNIKEISSVELENIIATPSYQKYWFAHKDLIDVCKECEFRHMCVDNRLPVERSKDEWFHTIECNYNPYIAKWAGEEGYQTLEECGVISNESGFSIDHEKIAIINAGLEELDITE
jgi:SPASM domain peptide maturase of grasp-with-spasm system